MCAAGGNVKGAAHMEKIWQFRRTLKTELSYDPAILLDIDPKELKAISQRDIYIPMFVAALFTVANMWKQPKFLLTRDWINKCGLCIADRILFFRKRGDSHTVKTWMNLEDVMLSKISLS